MLGGNPKDQAIGIGDREWRAGFGFVTKFVYGGQ